MATSGRSTSRPMGDTSREYVRDANRMVSRTVLICWLLMSLGVLVILEQPRGSLMELHPRFQSLLRQFPMWRTHIEMGDFGASTRKPTWLYSNYGFVGELNGYPACRARVPKDARPLMYEYKDSNGQRKFDGQKQDLKKSQHYPPGFGRAIAKLFLKHRPTIASRVASLKKAAKVKGCKKTRMRKHRE